MYAERPSHLCKDVNGGTDLTSLNTSKVAHPNPSLASQVFLGQLPCQPQPPNVCSDPPCPRSIVRAHLQDGAVETL